MNYRILNREVRFGWSPKQFSVKGLHIVYEYSMSDSFDKQKRPKVGVGVFVTSKRHPRCILIGKRKSTLSGEGLYALPGGHLEFGESWENCASRETLEETGLRLQNVEFCTVLNAIEVDKDYHYVEIFMIGDVDTNFLDEPQNLEPDKCEGWSWCDWEKLPESKELFYSLTILKNNGYNPFI